MAEARVATGAQAGLIGRRYGLLLSLPLRWTTALAAGAISAFAFAPVYAVPLLLVAIPTLLWLAVTSDRARTAGLVGWWFGLGHFAVGSYWIIESFANQPAVPNWQGPPAVLALAAYLALYPALACAFTRHWPRPGIAGLIIFAAAWGGAEWLRGHLLTGFPWNPLSAVWSSWPAMMQPLAVMGSYALSLLTALLSAAPALLLPRFGGWRANRKWLIVLLAGLALWAGFGAHRLDRHGEMPKADLVLRLVQPNIPQREKWQDELRRQHFADYIAQSEMLSAPEARLLVVWPETAVTDYYFDRQPSRRALAARMLPDGGYLTTGAPRVLEAPSGETALANSLLVLDDDGRLQARYDKQHLVPFGEYLPFRDLLRPLGLDKLAPGAVDFLAGPGPRTIEVDGLPAFSPLICYEVIFPGEVVFASGRRPAFLLNITNDAWFGNGSGPYQHFAQARMRTVEEGLPLVRAAQTGISAVVDPLGRVQARIGLERRGTIDALLPAALSKPTPYAKFGDISFAILLLLSMLVIILTRKGK